MTPEDRKEALRLAKTFDARTEISEDIIDAATLLSRLARCEHKWMVVHSGVTYMDSKCEHCGETRRESWD